MQTELTPGLYVSPIVPFGSVFVLNVAAFGLGDGLGGSERAVAISTQDWERIPGESREKLLDEFTHRFAEQGISKVQAWLRLSLASRDSQQTGDPR